MSDISRNNVRRTFSRDTSDNIINSSLYAIVNEMLNGIEDDEIQDTRDFNPFHYRRRGNFTIGRNVDSASPLFNMINQIFDTSRNIQSSIIQNINETDNDEPIIEQITFQVTYPLNFNMPQNNDISQNLNDPVNTINSIITDSVNSALNNIIPFGTMTRTYNSTLYNPIDNFSSGGLFQQILTQSLYDETVYKKKISEKGKSQLIHIRFDKNNSENINTSCPINQTEFENEQYIIQLPCNHNFTPDAINRWLDEKPECPVCRFEIDSIEVKREINDNLQQTRIPQSPIMTPINNSGYNEHYRNRRFVGRDRIQLNDNSHLDYLYEEIDNNDFQRALILSYRELIDISGGDSNTNETNTIDMFESTAAYISDNMPDVISGQDSEINESSEISISEHDEDTEHSIENS